MWSQLKRNTIICLLNVIRTMFNENLYSRYLAKFLVAFCLLYFGTEAFIGLAAPGGFYISFFDHYLNYIAWLRASILIGAKTLLAVFGYEAYRPDKFLLKLANGEGVRMVYACIGYGIMSFWIAFVFANKGRWQKKAKWISGGLLSIWLINVIRVSVLLLANSKNKRMPLGIDHHTWFNIAAYLLIFVLIYFYDRSSFKRPPKFSEVNSELN